MKVSTLQEQAVQCKTQSDADELLRMLIKAFMKKGVLSHLNQANSESFIEGDKPYVKVEFNRVVSDGYIIMIQPEIRDNKLIVVVVTQRMLDGLGLSSESWEAVEKMDDQITCYPAQSIDEVVVQAMHLAIDHHRQLIESVGVPSKLAKDLAREYW